MLAFVLASALAFTPADASLAHLTATNLVARHTPRDAGTRRGAAAADFLLDAASATGADVVQDRFSAMTPTGMRRFVNVSTELASAGTNAGWVVFLSHYDTKPGSACPGANDGASTSGLLVALARAFRRADGLPLNVMLVWTDGEECVGSYADDDGLWGSTRAAARLAESGRMVRAVVCLDMLGDSDLHVSVPRNSSPELRAAALRAAKAASMADKVSLIDEFVTDDHVPFLRKGFRAIDLIDFEYGSAPGRNDWWHTPKDTPDKISEESLLAAGRLAVALFSELAGMDAPASPSRGQSARCIAR